MTLQDGPRSARAVAAEYGAGRRRMALVAVALAFLLELIDSTIVNLAVPSIRHGLNASDPMIQWMIAGYALTFSMLLIVGGRLGDVFGYRRMFLGGVAAFAVTSGLCGIAQSALQLAMARGLQGAAAAMMAPQVMAVIQLLYPPHQRGSVLGLFGALGGLAASLGPVLGGLLIEANVFGLGWRPIFLINLPLALVALIGGFVALPAGRSPHPLRPDLAGAALVMGAIFLLVFPLIEGPERGWPAWSLGLLGLSAPLLAAFVWHVRRVDARGGSPLAPPMLFGRGPFRSGLAVNLILQTALAGYFLAFSLLLQLGLRLSALSASLTTLPFSIGVGLGIAVIGRRFGATLGRRLVGFGMAVLAAAWFALVVLSQAAHEPAPLAFAPVLLAGGLGMGMAIGPLSALTLAEVDVAHAGAASGLLSAVQQLGSALGAAVLGSLYFALAGESGGDGFVGALAPTLGVGIGLVLVAIALTRRLPARLAAPEVDSSLTVAADGAHGL